MNYDYVSSLALRAKTDAMYVIIIHLHFLRALIHAVLMSSDLPERIRSKILI